MNSAAILDIDSFDCQLAGEYSRLVSFSRKVQPFDVDQYNKVQPVKIDQ